MSEKSLKLPPLPGWIVESVKDLPAMLTLSEAAQFLRVSERQLYRLAEKGKLVMISTGGEKSHRRVPKVSLAEYLSRAEAA